METSLFSNQRSTDLNQRETDFLIMDRGLIIHSTGILQYVKSGARNLYHKKYRWEVFKLTIL